MAPRARTQSTEQDTRRPVRRDTPCCANNISKGGPKKEATTTSTTSTSPFRMFLNILAKLGYVLPCSLFSLSLLSPSLSPSSNFPNYAPSIITSCDTSLTNVDGIGAVPMTLTMITMSATMTTMMTTMLMMMMMTMVSLQGQTTHPTQQMTRQSTANPWAQALQAGDAAAAARKN